MSNINRQVFHGITISLIVSLCTSTPVTSANKVTGVIVRDEADLASESQSYVLPYGFYTDELGTVAGMAGGTTGFMQEQDNVFVTGLSSDTGVLAGYLFLNDYRTPIHDRIFMNASIGLGNFPRLRGYFDVGIPTVPPAGSNESQADNYIISRGYTDWVELDLKYIFATGSAKSSPLNVYTLNRGLLAGGASGGGVWNPFVSGRTYVGAKLFYYDRYYEYASGTRYTTSGLNLNFEYDNTDFPINPARGSRIRMSVKHDPGTYSGSATWTNAEAGFSKYIALSTGDKTEQRVVALNVWTANTFSTDMAPPNYGITLGGLYRMRAYPIERFYDRAAVYYSAEFRVVPRSELLRNVKLLRSLKPQWWELVSFYELGRVAPEWSTELLHSDMKSDVGLGLRVLLNKNIGRMDVAYSDEGWSILFMVGHPF